MLTKADWQAALNVQDACNLSGVAHDFLEVVRKVCDEAQHGGHGTEWKNTHPLIQLWVDKLYDLSIRHVGDNVGKAFDFAYKKVHE